MKENQNSTLYDSRSFGSREVDPFGSKDIYDELNGLGINNTHPLDECWNATFVGNRSETTGKEFQNGVLSRPDEDSDSLSSNANMLLTDAHFEEPEVMVCYKEISYHVVKDIRVDEGLIKDDQSGYALNNDSDCDQTTHGLVGLSLDNMKGVNENGSKSPSDSSSENDSPDHFDSEDASTKNVTKDASFVDRTLPIQEFGTRSFLRSFLNSLDDEEKLEDQISSGKLVHEDVQESTLFYNSKVENGTITFNFNSPESREVKDADSDNLLDNKTIIGKVEEQSLKIENAFSSDLSQPQCKETKDEIVHDDKDGNSNGQVVGSQGKYDEGEASFSAAGRVTYVGPMPYVGSVSHRSDGSATSGRSFAFPILQSEWSSSPERMDGDGTPFRKHKGWRSGLLCCRF